MTQKSGTALLLEQGIDLEREKVNLNLRKKSTVVIIDDAQTIFHDVNFWAILIKFAPTWLPSRIRFIISSTHLLSGGGPGPCSFQSFLKLDRSDFVLDLKDN